MAKREAPEGIDVADRARAALRDLARAFACEAGSEARLLTALTRAVMGVLVLAHADARGMLGASVRGALGELASARAASRHGELRSWLSMVLRAAHAELGASIFEPRAIAPIADAPVVDASFVARALDRLLPADDTRSAWAALEVEEVVGAYEGLVGFDLRIARGATLLVLPHHVGVDLEALLAAPASARAAKVADLVPASARLATLLERASSVDELRAALARRAAAEGLVATGSSYVEPGVARRRAGAHYTPRALTRPLVERTLAPLVDRAATDGRAILSLSVCDPAMGSGAFLVEVCRQLAQRVIDAEPAIDPSAARSLVAARCLHGVDADPLAVDLARAALWLLVGAPGLRADFADARLVAGDALVGEGSLDGPSREAAEQLCRARATAAFHWPDAFPHVMRGPRRGFDAFVGNPPWVAYAGRAAQPLDDDIHRFYTRHYPAFFGYRTLHGLFVYRAASLLVPGGRLGLVVPTSVSDLGGYEPTRRAHDTLCEVDVELPDFGDAFEGVFQPSMGLVSTRRAAPAPAPAPEKASIWRVARDDIDPTAASLLARLAELPTLPPACFGERGLQTSGDDVKKLRAVAQPEPPFVVPIREGGDLRAFSVLPPRLHLDPNGLTARLREPHEWREVRVLVRQTARFPIAARSDGLAFRNSILACFAAERYDADVLLAYLNASPIRWLHFMRHRDARQGMPQVKIAHLRSIPRVPGDAPAHLAELGAIGVVLGARNDGISRDEQRALDDVVASALALSEPERAMVAAWAERLPAP